MTKSNIVANPYPSASVAEHPDPGDDEKRGQPVPQGDGSSARAEWDRRR